MSQLKSHKWRVAPHYYRAATTVGTTMALVATLGAPRKWSFMVWFGF